MMDQDLDDAMSQLDAARQTVGDDQASPLRWQVHVDPVIAKVCDLMALKIRHHQELREELRARAASSAAEVDAARERLDVVRDLRLRLDAGEVLTMADVPPSLAEWMARR